MNKNSASPMPTREAKLSETQTEAFNHCRTSHNETPNISVCICTYQRPDWLRQTLESVQANSELMGSIEVIVVDNDPKASAAEAVVSFQLNNSISIEYHHERTKNISTARNKAIREARGAWIAFIDDDEIAIESWLRYLLNAADRYDADVVFGPVIPLYNKLTPGWIVSGGYFERKRLNTGTKVRWHHARTGNALVRRGTLPDLENPFPEEYGLTGGGDTVFFRELESLGASMIWCDEAVVYEHVPLARSTPRWLLARSFRLGQTWARIEVQSCGGPRFTKMVNIISISVLKIATALPFAILSAPFSITKSFEHIRTVANRVGKISVAFGYRYNEY